MSTAILRVAIIGGGVLIGYLTLAGASYIVSFVGTLGLQTTAERFEIDRPSHFSDIGFSNNRFARLSAVFAFALIGLICAFTFSTPSNWGSSLIAGFGGAALATAVIFAKPDILYRDRKSQ